MAGYEEFGTYSLRTKIPYSEEAKKQVEDVIHPWKHLFMEGYPCGRKTRKAIGIRMKKRPNPGICFTYLVRNDNGTITIQVLVSSVEKLLTKYTRKEIGNHLQMFLQEASDSILAML